MSSWEIKDSLLRLVDLSTAEEAAAMQLCRECLKEVSAGLKADADPEDPRITAAAAALAYYKVMLKRNTQAVSDEITSFKAGDVSISQGKSNTDAQLKAADEYRKRCFAEIVPLCQDNGFAFENVRIRVIL